MTETVLLLHSGGMSSRQWRKLSERLAPDYRVVAPDFLGSGNNPPWPDDAPFDLEQDLALLEVREPVHLVGHSYGALLALILASRHPQYVRSVSVYDPVAFGVLYEAGDAAGLADLDRVGQNPLFLDDAVGGREPWLRVFIEYWNGPGSWEGLPQASRDNFLRVGRKVYYEVRSLMKKPGDAYAGVEAPALLLTGEKTPVAAQRVVHLLASAMPHATVRCIAGAGHMGPITHADEVNDLISRHIRRDGPLPGCTC